MKELPSFLQDTKHVLQLVDEMNKKVETGEISLDGVALVTLDVEAMYNNMTDELAGGASKEFLEGGRNGSTEVLKVKTESILDALELCLKNNIFSFNEKVYQQTGGVGTGIKLAPPYACLGMGKFEQEAFKKDNCLLGKVQLWKRFIDDVLMLFKGSKEECENLVSWLNSLYPGVIKFKHEYSTEMVEFLDLKILLEGGKLETNLYIKPSNLQLYLDYFSNHPEPCKEGLVYGQAVRILERCSKPEWGEEHLKNLRSKLSERNYPEKLISEKFAEARKKSRGELINQKRKTNKNQDDKVRLIFTHNRGNPPLYKWIREARGCLVKNEKAKALGEKIQICHSQPKNLKRIVTQKKDNRPCEDNPGCTKCGKCKVSCPILKEGKTFTSTNTGRTYRIKQKVNCTSSFVIYLATCGRCSGQYVGKSQTPFKMRHSNHKQEVKKKVGGLGQHYGGSGCGYQNLSIQIIEQVDMGDTKMLENQEIYWQNQLRCYIQNGGNAHCRRKEKKS